METYFTIEEECESDLITAVEDYLKTINHGERRIYFSGEFDSHQSDFERASNNLEIGVLALNETVALILLFFLRIITDRRDELLLETVTCVGTKSIKTKNGIRMKEIYVKNGDKVTMKDIIDKLAEREKSYTKSFKLDEKFSVNLYYGSDKKTIVKDFDEIDVWSFPRIMSEIRDRF